MFSVVRSIFEINGDANQETHMDRRELLGGATAALAAALTGTLPAVAANPTAEPFKYMLNTATIMGQKLPLSDEVELAARCGYQAIEPWIRELDQFVKAGGSLKDLGKRIADNGLTVESSIGFAEWIVDEDARRKKGLEEARRDMDMVRQIGGKRMAAPRPAPRSKPIFRWSRSPSAIGTCMTSARKSASYRKSSSGAFPRR